MVRRLIAQEPINPPTIGQHHELSEPVALTRTYHPHNRPIWVRGPSERRASIMAGAYRIAREGLEEAPASYRPREEGDPPPNDRDLYAGWQTWVPSSWHPPKPGTTHENAMTFAGARATALSHAGSYSPQIAYRKATPRLWKSVNRAGWHHAFWLGREFIRQHLLPWVLERLGLTPGAPWQIALDYAMDHGPADDYELIRVLYDVPRE